jgi:hypothetical protein
MFDDSLYEKVKEPCEAPDKQKFTFDKMFPLLPSFAEGQDPDDVVRRLRLLGKKGGLMDASDPLVTITNPLDSNLKCSSANIDKPCNPDNDNPNMTVGFTFLGQFLDHDITLDKQPLTSPTPTFNERTPFFDLDSVYGQGPEKSKRLYDKDMPAKLHIDLDAPRDLPRESNQQACIADPRNDENVIISQLHLGFIRFHNQVVNRVQEQTGESDPKKLFAEARRLVTWHYQYIIVNQFLKATLDTAVYEQVKKDGPTVFKPSAKPAMPREFQVAAYRFGHSQIRPGYKINILFGAPIFDAKLDARDDKDPDTPQDSDPNDLRGGRRAPRRFVEWDTFFDFGTQEVAVENDKPVARPKVKKNKRIDPFISSPMFDLPVGPGLPGPEDQIRTLAGRNLERHLQHKLASGQDIATALGYPPLKPKDTAVLKDLNFHERTPLWWYILKEALVQHKGQRLGKVGSRIIAEVFFGLLLSDKTSYWSVKPDWKPELEQRNGDKGKDFTMTDLLTFARVA